MAVARHVEHGGGASQRDPGSALDYIYGNDNTVARKPTDRWWFLLRHWQRVQRVAQPMRLFFVLFVFLLVGLPARARPCPRAEEHVGEPAFPHSRPVELREYRLRIHIPSNFRTRRPEPWMLEVLHPYHLELRLCGREPEYVERVFVLPKATTGKFLQAISPYLQVGTVATRHLRGAIYAAGTESVFILAPHPTLPAYMDCQCRFSPSRAVNNFRYFDITAW